MFWSVKSTSLGSTGQGYHLSRDFRVEFLWSTELGRMYLIIQVSLTSCSQLFGAENTRIMNYKFLFWLVNKCLCISYIMYILHILHYVYLYKLSISWFPRYRRTGTLVFLFYYFFICNVKKPPVFHRLLSVFSPSLSRSCKVFRAQISSPPYN